MPFQPDVKGRKWNGQDTEAPSHCQPPRGGSQNVHAGYGVGAGRSSDLQARSTRSIEFPTDPRFPFYERTVLLWVFVPAYRCGAVPDLHRVPSRRSRCRDRHQRTASIYGVDRGVSRLNVGVVLLSPGGRRSEWTSQIFSKISVPLIRLQEQMSEALSANWMTAEQDQRISEAVELEQARLRNFIRKRVPDERDAEDILQEVFYELVEAYRMMKPVQQVGAWLFRVARNRITDLLRKRRPEALRNDRMVAEDGELLLLEDLLPSPDAGPEAAYARNVLLEELDAALDELPEEQREIFIAHELEGYSFKELAAATGLGVNTLLSRKHYAVIHLRQRLQVIYDEFTKA